MRDVSNLHQGQFLHGEKPDRKWIAVILSEGDIETVLEELNSERKESGEPPMLIDDLDLDYLAEKYSVAMTEGWHETMKALLDFDGERFLKSD